jgi:hypothetical protein
MRLGIRRRFKPMRHRIRAALIFFFDLSRADEGPARSALVAHVLAMR